MNIRVLISKYHLDKKTWTHKALHAILHFFFPVGEQAIRPLRTYYGDSHTLIVFFIKDNYVDWYWNNEDMTRLRTSFIRKMHRNPKTLDRLLFDWRKRVVTFNRIMQAIDRTRLQRLENAQLLNLYYRWYGAYLNEYALAIGIQDAFSMHAEEFLAPHFEALMNARGYGAQRNDMYLALMNPFSESFITRERRDLLKILALKRRRKSIDGALERHAKKYYWLQNNYAKDLCLDGAYFRKQLQSMKRVNPKKEIAALNAAQNDGRRKKQRVIRMLHLDTQSRNLIRITEIFAYMQDERKKYVLIASHYQRLFMEEFGKRLHLDRRHMEYTFIHELKTLLQQKRISTRVFDERRKHGVLVINTLKGYEVISGKVANDIFKKIFAEKEKHIRTLRGSSASTGKAVGLVKVVRKIHDIVNVHEGAILVASMTRPEMVSAMKKARAIVTDEGGVTCHAAVVSRELGIPCIIGTKIATKVLKDGDRVEVDAEAGVVRKL